jgi:hypothetical protein
VSKHLSVSYSKAGDLLKVYWDDDPCSADHPAPNVYEQITLLRSLADETRVVGVKIADLTEVLDRAGLKLVPKDVPLQVGDPAGGPTVALCSYCHLPMGSAACQQAHP